MTTGAAVIAIVASLMAGYYFAQWRRSQGSLRSAKALAKVRGTVHGKHAGTLLLTGLAIAVVIYLWNRGWGR